MTKFYSKIGHISVLFVVNTSDGFNHQLSEYNVYHFEIVSCDGVIDNYWH